MLRRPLPEALSSSAFAVSDALQLGVTPSRLRALDLESPHRGVRTSRVAETLLERCLKYRPLLGDCRGFSHITALALWGLPLPERPENAPLHVAAFAGREPRREGVIGHRLTEQPLALVEGCPVVQPLAAWAQSSTLLSLDDLIAVADALRGRWSPRPAARGLHVERLDEAVRAHGRARGALLLREALDLSRPNVWSPGETRLRLVLVRAGLPEPELNAEVRDDSGRFLGVPDLVFREARVALEYEGDHHRIDPATFERDIRRRERFADAGWRLVRVTRADLGAGRRELVTRVATLVAG